MKHQEYANYKSLQKQISMWLSTSSATVYNWVSWAAASPWWHHDPPDDCFGPPSLPAPTSHCMQKWRKHSPSAAHPCASLCAPIEFCRATVRLVWHRCAQALSCSASVARIAEEDVRPFDWLSLRLRLRWHLRLSLRLILQLARFAF